MVTVLVLASGILGFLVALTALIFGASPLAALALWSGIGLLLTLAGLTAPLRARPHSQRV